MAILQAYRPRELAHAMAWPDACSTTLQSPRAWYGAAILTQLSMLMHSSLPTPSPVASACCVLTRSGPPPQACHPLQFVHCCGPTTPFSAVHPIPVCWLHPCHRGGTACCWADRGERPAAAPASDPPPATRHPHRHPCLNVATRATPLPPPQLAPPGRLGRARWRPCWAPSCCPSRCPPSQGRPSAPRTRPRRRPPRPLRSLRHHTAGSQEDLRRALHGSADARVLLQLVPAPGNQEARVNKNIQSLYRIIFGRLLVTR